jgi:hypothetical protein
VNSAIVLPDVRALDDLETFAGRAHRVDPDGACRLVASGGVLAAYVSPVHAGGGPTVLGLRVLGLAPGTEPAHVDVTVPLAGLLDRFARMRSASEPAGNDAPVILAVPPAEGSAPWAGVAPPRSGWDAVGLLDAPLLRSVSADGVREIADGAPAGAGAAAVARLRGQVWGRPVSQDLPDVPAGIAFAADALGFLDDAEPVVLYRVGRWVRATTRRGHVLARRPALL